MWINWLSSIQGKVYGTCALLHHLSPHTCSHAKPDSNLPVPQRRDDKDEVDDDEDEAQQRVACPPQDKAQVCPEKFLARASLGSISGRQMTGEGKH